MQCKDCENWNPQRDEAGQCRAHVPSAALVPSQGIGGPGLAVVTYWPETKPDDWCGEWMEGAALAFTAPLPLIQP